jgi:hypothetical protein
VVGLLRKQTTIEFIAVGKHPGLVDSALEHWGGTIFLGHIGHMGIVYPYFRILDAIPHQSDRNIRMTKIGVHHIGKISIRFALTVHHHTQQSAPMLFVIAIEHL